MYYHPPNHANLSHTNELLNEASSSINSSSNEICGLKAFGVGGVDTTEFILHSLIV
ncbi:hypothetical protein MKX01_015377 [Papaver californicum]|nr:hypothetical protein MKX01_015377 [Papaver californicum]